MKDEFEDIQRLIRLKRYETPGEGFTDELLTRLHRRLREDAAMPAAAPSFMQSLSEAFRSWMSPPQWAMAAAALVLCGAGIWAYTFSDASAQVAKTPSPKAPATQVADTPKAKDNLVGEEEKAPDEKPQGVVIPTSHTPQE
ncbi:MAG: hypothetical protein IPK32_02970 [Verrucomicrobiaceae bacterium]|nr:hypothetical protein [Verrucomicrobiaceae bacterium]